MVPVEKNSAKKSNVLKRIPKVITLKPVGNYKNTICFN